MQDWEKTNYEVYLELQHSQEDELMHYRTKGALNKKVAQYIKDGGKLINGKIVYAKKAAKNASDKFVKNVDKHLDRYNYHNSKMHLVNGYDQNGFNVTMKVDPLKKGVIEGSPVPFISDVEQYVNNKRLKRSLKKMKTKDKLKYAAMVATPAAVRRTAYKAMLKAAMRGSSTKKGHTQPYK